ncbi:MAG: hypothetical protein J0I09_00150 [Sphingobacteriia bacterium]|nr:hypothetical protein [Sphingobacteriia bacterium]
MKIEELKNITSDFVEISQLLEKRNKLFSETNKVRRKLKSKINKYKFLVDLVDTDSNGGRLVNAVVQLFKSIGFSNIENVDKKYNDEDIRLWLDDLLIIFEITGIDTANPKDDKAYRISKHIPIRQKQNPNLKVFGVFIVNHDNKKHFKKREKKPFRKNLIEIAKEHKYTLTTTVDIFNAFIKIKKDSLTKDDFIKCLCMTGELKILGA